MSTTTNKTINYYLSKTTNKPKPMISPEVQAIFDEWDNLPIEEKKRRKQHAKEMSDKTQGTFFFTPGFSFDSDSKIKLYEVNA